MSKHQNGNERNEEALALIRRAVQDDLLKRKHSSGSIKIVRDQMNFEHLVAEIDLLVERHPVLSDVIVDQVRSMDQELIDATPNLEVTVATELGVALVDIRDYITSALSSRLTAVRTGSKTQRQPLCSPGPWTSS